MHNSVEIEIKPIEAESITILIPKDENAANDESDYRLKKGETMQLAIEVILPNADAGGLQHQLSVSN